MKTYEDIIWKIALRWPERAALVCGSSIVTYGQLWKEVERQTQRFCEWHGQIAAVRATPDVSFVINYLAIHQAGAVAAPLDAHCSATVFEDLAGRMQGKKMLDDVADVLYTTGTTGMPKGVMVSHRAIRANVDNLTRAQGYTQRHTVIVHGPLNHIGSLSKLQVALSVGATVYLLDGLKDLNGFFAIIERCPWRVATFLVPAQIQMLLRFAKDKLASLKDKIDFIETGASAIAEADMRQLCDTLPHTRLYNTYASTETGIIATHDFQHDGCEAGCLGQPMHHSAVEIAPDGHIVCMGDTLMTGYLADDRQTSEVLQTGKLYTADLGRLDTNGRLHLVGREDDILNVGGFKVAPQEVEDAVASFPSVSDSLCTVTSHPVMGHVLTLLVVCHGQLDQRALVQYLQRCLEPHKVPLIYKKVEVIARTFNGKPDRKHYLN